MRPDLGFFVYSFILLPIVVLPSHAHSLWDRDMAVLRMKNDGRCMWPQLTDNTIDMVVCFPDLVEDQLCNCEIIT